MKDAANENLKRVYRAELATEQAAKALEAKEDRSFEEVRDGYSSLLKAYSKLLRETMIMTRLSDRSQHKLIKLQEELRHQNEVIKAKEGKLLELNRQLMEASVTDSLTGLKNRRFLTSFLTSELERLKRLYDRPYEKKDRVEGTLLFVLVDIDHFKRINDAYGHPAGDEVLRQFADIIEACCRTSDFAVRWGGEEFLLVCRDSHRGLGRLMAERLRENVLNHVFKLNDHLEIHCTCSIGFSYFPVTYRENRFLGLEEVVNLADQALYVAKKSGRNAWVGVIPNPSYAALGDEVPLELEMLRQLGYLDLITSLESPAQLVL
ncbi:GGDEF domain-containing protein [Acanthopleuribacter pedis]|uniref:diguanylate cyclase n=1 Tax=Acanthopleuribacter pedis TaxID=442870 RepID=A0A8J7QA70_9BACT|nr:GGDEF domain-containing protein [Acanthopleuribacter pedis]MBO1321646.1 diguanylate cyclase [Acanthopleuribacter pedis]